MLKTSLVLVRSYVRQLGYGSQRFLPIYSEHHLDSALRFALFAYLRRTRSFFYFFQRCSCSSISPIRDTFAPSRARLRD
jgi:hypothetical protein